MKPIYKKILLWLVALVILAFFFYRLPKFSLKEALSVMDGTKILIYCISCFFILFFFEIVSLYQLLRTKQIKVKFGEVFFVRGVSYFWNIVNNHLAQLTIPIYLKRKANLKISSGYGILSLIYFIELFWLVMIALFAVFFLTKAEYFQGSLDLSLLKIFWSLGALALIAFFFIFRSKKTLTKLIQKLPEKISEAISRARLIYQNISLPQLGLSIACRIPVVFMNVGVAPLLWLNAAGASLDWHILLATYPLVILISQIPITPSGLGTTQAALIIAWTPYIVTQQPANEDQIKAIILLTSLTWVLINLSCKIITGSVFYLIQKRKGD